MAGSSVIHQYDPDPGVLAGHGPHELKRGVAREIAVVEMAVVPREDDFRACRGAGSGIPRAAQPNILIRNPRFGDVKKDGVAGLRVIVNVVRSGHRAVTLHIEVT